MTLFAVALSLFVSAANAAPAEKPALRELATQAGPQAVDAVKAPPVAAAPVRAAQIVYECLGMPEGWGRSHNLHEALKSVCSTCGTGMRCQYECFVSVDGRRSEQHPLHGSCGR